MAMDTDNAEETTSLSKSTPNTDDVLKASVGNFGRWQFKISILMALLKFPIAWFQLSIVFLAPPTQFWCKPSDEENTNLTRIDWLALSRASNGSLLTREGLNTGYCTTRDIEGNTNGTLPCTNGYVFNTTIFRSTIVSEWGLVCGNQRLIDLSQVTLMFGVLIGNILFGLLADRRGRKPVLIFCVVLQTLCGVLASLIPWYWGFLASRFLLAIANGGITVTSFVMCMETVGGKWRTIVPILYQIPFGFGNSLMAGVAYLAKDWRQFHLALSVMSALFVFYAWLIPESPRWLIATGQKKVAIEVLQRAAKDNKMDADRIVSAMTELSNVRTSDEKKPSFSTLFSTPQLRKRSLLLYLNWAIGGVSFYAFSQYLGHVSRNLYLTVACSGLIALPGTVLCVWLVSWCGRRWTIAVAHLVTAACFLAIIAVPKGQFVFDWPRIVFAAIGVIGLSVSVPALYLFTGELYPTVLRNAGVGASVMFTRLGSMVAPLIISLEEVTPSLPLAILGVAALIETALILPLPETMGRKLPETVMDLSDRKSVLRMSPISPNSAEEE